MPLPVDRLLPVRVAAEDHLGVSLDTYLRREADPQRFPGWPQRVVVGHKRNGIALYAVKLSAITHYVDSVAASARPATSSERRAELAELGRRGALKRQAQTRTGSIAESTSHSTVPDENAAGARTDARRKRVSAVDAEVRHG